jgi:DNA repair exonuclease SbcCD nuclease subunit
MGHFEITSFNMTVSQVCENGLSSDDLFRLAPLVFSGHFHLRCDRKYGGGRRIIYVGSPYELDWGDYGSTKGIYFYDPEKAKIDFVENTFSPRHVKLQYDPSIADDKEKMAEFKEQLKSVNGNIVKLVSDDSANLKQKDLQKIIEVVTHLSPGEFTCDLKSLNEDEKIEVEISNNLDPKDALMSYVDATCGEHATEIKKILLDLYNNTKH